jgi:hypothetical protein
MNKQKEEVAKSKASLDLSFDVIFIFLYRNFGIPMQPDRHSLCSCTISLRAALSKVQKYSLLGKHSKIFCFRKTLQVLERAGGSYRNFCLSGPAL